MSTETIRLIQDGGRGYGGGGKREIIYLSLHCHHQNDFCIKMGSDESHFNVSLIVRDKVTGWCPQTTTFFEEKGEPKRYWTEVLQLTSLTPYRQTGSQMHMIMSGVKLVMWPETVLGSAPPLTSFDVAHPGMAKLLWSVYFYNWLHPNIIVFDFTKVEYHG